MVDARLLVLAVPILAGGAYLILWGTGSQAVCFSADPCPAPHDAWEPVRLAGGMLGITLGSTLVLTGLWRHDA